MLVLFALEGCYHLDDVNRRIIVLWDRDDAFLAGVGDKDGFVPWFVLSTAAILFASCPILEGNSILSIGIQSSIKIQFSIEFAIESELGHEKSDSFSNNYGTGFIYCLPNKLSCFYCIINH